MIYIYQEHDSKGHTATFARLAEVDGQPFLSKDSIGRPVDVFPVLASAIADAPWSAKLARGCSHNASHGCWRCGIVGTMEAPDGTRLKSTAFGGYSEPAPCRMYVEEEMRWMDEEVAYTEAWLTDGEAHLNRPVAERLRVSDHLFVARGNTAEKIRDEEFSKRSTHPGASASTLLFAIDKPVLLCQHVHERVPETICAGCPDDSDAFGT
jgi:hypothetical protein